MLLNEQESSVFAKWSSTKRRYLAIFIAIAALAVSAYFITANAKRSETASLTRNGSGAPEQMSPHSDKQALPLADGMGNIFPVRISWACVDTCAIIAGSNSVHDTLVIRLMLWNSSGMPIISASMKIDSNLIFASIPGSFKFRASTDSLVYGYVPVNGFQPPFIQSRNFKFLVDSLASADPTKSRIGLRFQVAKIVSTGSKPALQDIATCATVWRPATLHNTPIGKERTARQDRLRTGM